MKRSGRWYRWTTARVRVYGERCYWYRRMWWWIGIFLMPC